MRLKRKKDTPPRQMMGANTTTLTETSFLAHFLRLFLPLALLLIGISYTLIKHDTDTHLQQYTHKEEASLELAASTALRDLSTILYNIHYLSQAPALTDFLASKKEADLDRLDQSLLAISKSTNLYDQVRFLDLSGMEISRINGVGTKSFIVPRKNLQHKGHRYYLAEARTQEDDVTYISPLDLNKEQGKVETPYKPVIRFASVIKDKEGERQGFLVLNFLANHILSNLLDITEYSPGDFLFLNKDGDYIVAPEPGDEWGFAFDSPGLFASRNPKVWKQMLAQDRGTYKDDSGLYIFRALYPRWYKNNRVVANQESNTVAQPLSDTDPMRWVLVSHLSPEQQEAIFREKIEYAYLVLFALLVVLTMGCLKISKVRLEKESEITKNLAIANSSYEAIIMMDHHGKISFWNPAAERIFGYTPKEALGKDIHNLISPPKYRNRFHDHFPSFLMSGEGDLVGRTQELTGLRKNNEEFPVELSLNAARINNHWHGVALLRDISARKKSEEHLRKLSLAVEESPVSIVITDKHGRIEYVNPKFCKASQYSAKEAIGANPRILKSGLQSPEHYKQMWRTLLSGKEWHGEFANRRKNGEVYWERASISPLRNEDGKISHFVAIKEDISLEREVLDNLKKAKKEAERANKAKSDFVANMSHEIRTPMNAIIGLSELALDMDMASEPQNYFNKIHQAGRSLLAIINDILDYSKIEAGEFTVSPMTFDIDELIDRLANLFGSRVWEKNLELLFRVDDDVPRALIADDMRLSQILINLIGNALKFTEQGEILVRVQKTSKDYEPLVLKFSVQDSGIGISQEKIADLFSPFQQADSSTSRKYGGTGLGLTISKQLVELMKGHFEVSSELGRGSIFSFSIPCKREEDTESPRYEFTLPSALQNAKILVADDNDKVCHIIASHLQLFSLRPTTVPSGQAVLDALANAPADDPFSLLIIDWKMPGMDGIETCTHIRNDDVYSKLPIVLLSGWNPKEFAKKAQGKIDGILSKPITAPSLFKAIMDALGPQEKTRNGSLPQAMAPQKSKGGEKLLVAEDNVINQEVALQILTKAGFSVKIVNDGREAIEAFKESQKSDEGRFAAILMDIQMPGIDGFEATKQIRQLEKTTKDEKAIAIIAMTAQAFSEDRDKCLAAGMDDFISKPFEQKHLLAILARHTKGFSPSVPEDHEPEKPPAEVPPPLQGSKQQAIDKKDALRRIGGKEEFLNHLFTIFRDDYAKVDDLIKEAFKNNDTEKAIRLAHTISGAAANLSAVPLAQSAKNLQITIEKNGNFEESCTLFSKDLKEMIAAINELVPPSASPARRQSETAVNQDELAPLFDELISLLEMNSYKVTETVQQFKEIIPASYQDKRLSTLYRHIDNFEYSQALEIATTLRNENIPTT